MFRKGGSVAELVGALDICPRGFYGLIDVYFKVVYTTVKNINRSGNY
jgi:hypothetical protein